MFPLSVISGLSESVVQTGHLGRTMLATDGSKSVVAEHRFYPWGRATRYPAGAAEVPAFGNSGDVVV